MVSIGTERLLLKRLKIWHVPQLVDTYRDPRTLTQLVGTCSLWVAFWRLVWGCIAGTHWTIFLASDRHPIGSVGLRTWRDGRPELVYWIAPDHWGASVATEAITGALDQRRRRPIVALSRPTNLGSCLVLEKLGFATEAELRRYDTDQRLYVLN